MSVGLLMTPAEPGCGQQRSEYPMNPYPAPDNSGEWIPRKSDQENPHEGAEDGDDGIVVHGARALLRCAVRDTQG